MENVDHDAVSYEKYSYERDLTDGNVLYAAMRRAMRGSDWKPQVQKFEMNYLFELARMQKDLQNRNYAFQKGTEFILHERGKTRAISGEQIRDRVVKHALCDAALMPAIKKHLIYDNGASIQGKGIAFTRKRLVTHLRKYYAQHGSNEGYILLMDFSKFYDNIRHAEFLEIARKYVQDETAIWLLEKVLEESRVDVSYMSDAEYAGCMDKVFDSLEYREIDKALLTGEKFMKKHMNIGDQVSQIAGIAYPMRIDSYVKIVRGFRFYGRYMDDLYAIHESKEALEELRGEIIEIAGKLGITVNERKTRIAKLSEQWSFLQIRYRLTETGRIARKINAKSITRMRRKMKKLGGRLNAKEFRNWFNTWYEGCKKYMSKEQRKNILREMEGIRCTR